MPQIVQFEQLGPYRLGKKLGQGGMGSVFEATDTTTGEPAAVKVLAPALAADESFRVRFQAEIESLKKLRHPNIVRLYGYGEQGGTLFYAMELVEGTSLEDELRAGHRYSWREVTDMAVKICRALKHAHDHGVIHRDIKPANLLITPSGELKLSDFGIARLFGNTRMTSDGGVLGTAEYMAPEQADGRPVTDRCDQYSLGGVMYALLAGRPPFRAGSLLEMLQLQRYADPDPVRRYAPETPAELEGIIQQLLHKDPQKRFANTLLVARSLEAMEKGLSISIAREQLREPVQPAPDSPLLDPGATTLIPSQVGKDAEAYELDTPYQTEATVAFAQAPPPAEPPAIAAPAVEEPRFTKVEDELKGVPRPWHTELATVLSPPTIALACGLIAIGAAVWYALQPPSADRLFDRVETLLLEGEPTDLHEAETAADDFLKLYVKDPRVRQMRKYRAEIRLGLDERRAELNARRLRRSDARSAAERAYIEAVQSVKTQPEQATAKLQALIDLYGDSPQDQHFVELARRQLAELNQQIAGYSKQDLRAIAARLDYARQIEGTEPKLARKIRQGVVQLYGDKPWAAAQVRKARESLAATREAQAATASGR